MKTALICNAAVTCLIFGGTGYAVFAMGHSPWWFLAAVVIDQLTTQRVRTVAQ